MTRLLAVAAALGLTACSRPPKFTTGVGDELPIEVFRCNSLAAPVRDWCVVQALDLSVGSGRDIYELCRRMQDPLARDRCIDVAVRHPTDPAPASVCAYVRSLRLADACVVSAALQQADTDVAGAFQTCGKAGRAVTGCVSTVLDRRIAAWSRLDATEVRKEVDMAVRVHLPLAYDASFGATVGAAAHALGPTLGAARPCEAFPSGSGRLACEVAFIVGPTG